MKIYSYEPLSKKDNTMKNRLKQIKSNEAELKIFYPITG